LAVSAENAKGRCAEIKHITVKTIKGDFPMITVNRCGYDSKHRAILDSRSVGGNDDYTLLLVKTEAYFERDGRILDTPPNTVILYSIHSYIHYGCRSPHYNDDWIHFDLHGEDSDLLQKLSLPLDTPFVLPYMGTLTDYSRLVVIEKLSSHVYRENIIDSLMHTLLYSLASQYHTIPEANSNSKYYYPMNGLRMEILNAPNKKWNVSELADQIHISTSHFQHLYKVFFGISCMQDIITARIKYAKFYLRTTEMSIHSLAAFCGYDSELHFMRQFKKATDLTPSQYRALHKQQSSAVKNTP